MNDEPQKADILATEPSELVEWLSRKHIEPYRAGQILRWIYQRRACRFEQMTDLNLKIRRLLESHFFIPRLAVEKIQRSGDGTCKYLFKLTDGNLVESVLIPEKGHYTLCISSQVGCAQGCRFCLTGQMGLVRNLTRSEIISQVRDILADLPAPVRLSNIVLMGMGEPLANYTPVIRALATLCDTDCGLNFSERKITLSTVGLVPRMSRLGRDSGVNLAVSLNATDNATRNRLMPVNRRYPIERLIEACQRYPLKPRRRITFEYVLLKGINDTVPDARRLARLLAPVKAKINLIPFNAHPGSPYERPPAEAISRFQEILISRNYTVMIRNSKGRDISAACGQLRTETASLGTPTP